MASLDPWDDFYRDVPVAERPLDKRLEELPNSGPLPEYTDEWTNRSQRELSSVWWGV
jgi:hypothetical protein